MSRFTLTGFADEMGADLSVQIHGLKTLHISYIEVRGVNGKGMVNHTLEEAEAVAKELSDNGLRVSSLASPIGKIRIDEDFAPHLELFRHTLKIADILEAPYIRMFSFFIPEGDDPARHRDEVLRRWDAMLEAAQGYSGTLLHENEKHIYGDTAERCLDLLKTLNTKKLRAAFDPANFVQCDEETYPKAYELLKDYIAYMHIKDALYSTGGVVPPGQGDGHVKEVLHALYRKGYQGFVSLEPHLGKFEGLADLELDDFGADLPEGGPKMFAVAATALQRIINEIEG